MNTPLLPRIDSPASVRLLSKEELRQLANELRAFIIEQVSSTGGHLSSNLGTVELTIALHHVFNLPSDRLVWDVGHQSYPHKALTGRQHRFPTLRQRHGMSGFPRRDESPYDAFGTAHSSTAISAALGMACGAALNGDDRKAIAVVGDGALSGGMAMEALNNASASGRQLIVILNDNEMSISEPVGALSAHFAQLIETAGFRMIAMPPREEAARRRRRSKAVGRSAIFAELGFDYRGPVDGHDIEALCDALQRCKKVDGPVVLHVRTRKGHGYVPAEQDPIAYHGPGKFDPSIGLPPAAPQKPTFTSVFGQWMCDMAERDHRIVGITPAMREGSGLVEFARRFPRRYHDVGIAEQHAVTFAAGLACEGLKPVVAIYSTFLQRAYDQLVHDVAMQDLPVVFAVDRAGLVGPDGATHAGAYDIAFLRCIPNISILTPSDENECRQALFTAFQHQHPTVVRYPRGSGCGTPVNATMTAMPFGKGEIRLRSTRAPGGRVAILAFGTVLPEALEAAKAIGASVANMRFVKPLDVELVIALARDHDLLVTIEDGCVEGGAGSAVAQALSRAALHVPIVMLGLPDVFVPHGTRDGLMAECGLNAQGIVRAVEGRLGELAGSGVAVPV
jgi:1-deoxy-D-xylulose-5-phosphate synthase